MSTNSNFYLDYNVTGPERKKLVQAIGNYVGADPEYIGPPSFAYRVDNFTIDKNGCVSFESNADSEGIEGLIEVLAEQGFVAISSNLADPEDALDADPEDDVEPEEAPADEAEPTAEDSDPEPDEAELEPEASDPEPMEEGTTEDEAEPTAADDADDDESEASEPEAAEDADPGVESETEEDMGEDEPEAEEAPESAENGAGAEGAIPTPPEGETPPSAPESPAEPAFPPEVLARLEALRNTLIRDVNRAFDGILSGTPTTREYRTRSTPVMGNPGEIKTMSLYDDVSVLRGTKPLSVKCGDTTIYATSWKKVAGAIMDICNRQEQYHEALLKARDTIAGRGRKFLSASPQGMLSPMQIDNDLYMETNFSTEALLKLVKDRILGEIGFDGKDIILEYRLP